MAFLVFLDAGVVGLTSSRTTPKDAAEFSLWVDDMLEVGADLIVSDLTRYEVRRELCRLKAQAQIQRLDAFCQGLTYAPVTREAWVKAGELWGIIRSKGMRTGPDNDLDGDAILAGSASTIGGPNDRVVIATTNVKHLKFFPDIDARLWRDIPPNEAKDNASAILPRE